MYAVSIYFLLNLTIVQDDKTPLALAKEQKKKEIVKLIRNHIKNHPLRYERNCLLS
jgi:hypothetical protein